MTSETQTQDPDLSIFKQEYAVCTDSNCSTCPAITRLFAALRYYALLNVKEDEDHREIFASFVYEIYGKVVEDNNHLMLIHADQLREISDLFGFKCEMKTCQQTQRHFESESTINIVGDHSLNFFANLHDSLHFYICHCYDAGFRVDANEKSEESNNDKGDQELFDAEFARMNTAI